MHRLGYEKSTFSLKRTKTQFYRPIHYIFKTALFGKRPALGCPLKFETIPLVLYDMTTVNSQYNQLNAKLLNSSYVFIYNTHQWDCI